MTTVNEALTGSPTPLLAMHSYTPASSRCSALNLMRERCSSNAMFSPWEIEGFLRKNWLKCLVKTISRFNVHRRVPEVDRPCRKKDFISGWKIIN